jgi:hypothetical protein
MRIFNHHSRMQPGQSGLTVILEDSSGYGKVLQAGRSSQFNA